MPDAFPNEIASVELNFCTLNIVHFIIVFFMFAILYVFSSLSTILHNMSKISNQKFNAQLIYVP